jgi:hypothetical protein
MRTLSVLLALPLIHISALAQGTILFDTQVPGIVDAPFSVGRLPPGPSFGAELLLYDPAAGTLLTLSPTTTFKTGPGTDPFYVEPVVVTVPEHAPGSLAEVVMGIFELSDPRGPFCTGQSVVTVKLGGGDLPPAYLEGLGPSDVPPDCIPEPSILSLLALAGGGLATLGCVRLLNMRMVSGCSTRAGS